ncbi:hypothetical protein KCP75_17145 [Salmonella enterica subsp. enterica]|nr:hypothetical protein KCP75_17145 [Salmonella enterica subsp. enterica]
MVAQESFLLPVRVGLMGLAGLYSSIIGYPAIKIPFQRLFINTLAES